MQWMDVGGQYIYLQSSNTINNYDILLILEFPAAKIVQQIIQIYILEVPDI